MTDLNLKTFNKLYPMMIRKYSDLIIDQNASEKDKINSIILKLNALGKLSNDVVRDWNTVYQWAMNDGLTQDVNNKLEDMLAKGQLKSITDALVAEIGDLTTLTTPQKDTVVHSINSLQSEVTTNTTKLTEIAQYMVDKNNFSTTYLKNLITQANGADIYFPDGTYIIDDYLIDSTNGIDVKVSFKGKNAIIRQTTAGKGIIRFIQNDQNTAGIAITVKAENITFDGNNVSGDLIQIVAGGVVSLIINCKFVNSGANGFKAVKFVPYGRAFQPLLDKCEFAYNIGYGCIIDGMEQGYINNSHSHDNNIGYKLTGNVNGVNLHATFNTQKNFELLSNSFAIPENVGITNIYSEGSSLMFDINNIGNLSLQGVYAHKPTANGTIFKITDCAGKIESRMTLNDTFSDNGQIGIQAYGNNKVTILGSVNIDNAHRGSIIKDYGINKVDVTNLKILGDVLSPAGDIFKNVVNVGSWYKTALGSLGVSGISGQTVNMSNDTPSDDISVRNTNGFYRNLTLENADYLISVLTKNNNATVAGAFYTKDLTLEWARWFGVLSNTNVTAQNLLVDTFDKTKDFYLKEFLVAKSFIKNGGFDVDLSNWVNVGTPTTSLVTPRITSIGKMLQITGTISNCISQDFTISDSKKVKVIGYGDGVTINLNGTEYLIKNGSFQFDTVLLATANNIKIYGIGYLDDIAILELTA